MPTNQNEPTTGNAVGEPQPQGENRPGKTVTAKPLGEQRPGKSPQGEQRPGK